MKTMLLWLLFAAIALADYGGGYTPPPVHQTFRILNQQVIGGTCYVALTGGTRPYQARLYESGTAGDIGWWETDQSGFFFGPLSRGGYMAVFMDGDGCTTGVSFIVPPWPLEL